MKGRRACTWWLVVGIAALAARAGGASGPDAEASFRQLERDIPSLYLVNGLFLAPEQNDQLAGLLKQAGDLERQAAEQIRALERQQDELIAALDKAAARPGGGRSSKPLGGQNVRETLQRIRAVRDERAARVKELAGQAYGLMTPAQREILDGFTPCFIPPRDFREPVRVGQAKNDTGFGEKVFDRLRKIPEDQLGPARERAMEFIVPYVMDKRHIPFSEEAEAKVEREIEANLDAALPKIRGMSDVDYELEKSGLVAQVMPIEGAAKPLHTDRDEALWKTGVYVLNPGIADVIQARGTKAGAAAAPSGASLESVKRARDKMEAVRLVRRLGLTSAQVEQMLPVVRDGAAARDRVGKELQRVHEEALEPYTLLRSELAAQGPTEPSEKKALGCHQHSKKLDEIDLVEALRPFESRLDGILTASQVSMLAESLPGDRDRASDSPVDAAKVGRRAAETLDRARRMTPTEFEQSKRAVAAQFVASSVAEEDAVDVVAESGRAVSVLETARGLKPADYQARKQDLATELCPRRSSPRPVAYGAKYVKGEPLPVLARSSRVLFSDEGVQALVALANRPQRRAPAR